MKRSIISETISLVFCILFLYTGISKLMDYNIAKEQIALTPLFAPIAREIVILVPVIEIVTVVLLFIPKLRKIGFLSSLILMIAFTVYIIYIINVNDKLPCTCGGVLERLSWTQHVYLNIVLSVLALTGLILTKRTSEKIVVKEEYSPQL